MRLLWLSWQLRSSPPKLLLFLTFATPLAGQGSLTITTTQGSIPTGTVGTAYSFTFTASGGSGTYAWSVLAGGLPAGLSLTTATGLLSGTPTGCASYYNNPSPTTLAQPCNFPALFQNTFDPMVSSYVIQVNDGSTSVHQGFTTSVYWAPDLTTYLNTQNGYFASMAQTAVPSVLAGVPAPPLLAGGHLVIANPFFRSGEYDNQPAWNSWVDAMHDAGMSIVNIEVDLECLVAYHASCLALYKGAIDHAHALGMKVSINPAYYTTGNGNADPSCGDVGCPTSGPGVGTVGGIGGACESTLMGNAINSGTIPGTSYGSGVSDWHTCVAGASIAGLGGRSAYHYMLSQWLVPGDRFVPVHEPTTSAAQWGEYVENSGATDCNTTPGVVVQQQSCGAKSTGSNSYNYQTCPEDWWVNFLDKFFTVDLPSWSDVPAGINYGVTVNLREMGSAAYAAYFEANVPATHNSGTVYLGLDMYSFDSGSLTSYGNTIGLFQGTSGGTAHSVFVEEFGPQAWTYANGTSVGPTGEGCAIVGMQSCIWNSFNQNFFASLLPYLSRQGVTDASLYGANLLGACAPIYPDNPNDDDDVLNAVTVAMQGRQYSLASARLRQLLAQWNRIGISGGQLKGLVSLVP